MAEFRVLTPAYIQDAYRERGDIVDIDPASVLATDVHLERIKKSHKASVAPPVPPDAPLVAEKVPAAKDDEEKKAPDKPDVLFEMVPVKHDILDMSTPKPTITSPDGKESPIAKPAPEKPVPAPAPEKAAADDKKASAKDDPKEAAPEKPTSGKP